MSASSALCPVSEAILLLLRITDALCRVTSRPSESLSMQSNLTFSQKFRHSQTQNMPKDFLEYQNTLVPLHRFSEPDEQTGMCLLLLSDDSTCELSLRVELSFAKYV